MNKRLSILLLCISFLTINIYAQSKLQGAGKASKVGASNSAKTPTTNTKPTSPKKPSTSATPVKRSSGNEDKYASTAYMEISDVKFGNVDDEGHIIDNFGNKLYASEIKYLKPQLTYKGMATNDKEVSLYVKILKEDGSLEEGSTSPEGYTYKYDFTVKPGNNQSAALSGWGRNSGGSYSPGQYTFELWYKGKRIYQKVIRLFSGSTPLVSNSILKINRIAFGSEDADDYINIKMGETLYEGEVKYLIGNMHYEGLYSNEQKVTLYARIFFPSGSLSSGNGSPTGFSYKRDVTIKPGSNIYKISGWGNNNGTSYKEGKHKYEIWLDGEKIYETYFTVYKKDGSTYSNTGSSIDQFFPIWDIVLGKTTWREAENAGYEVKMWQNGPNRYTDVHNVTFWDHEGAGKFTQIYWTNGNDFPDSWKAKGFSWENSYDAWISTFTKLGFNIKVTKEPTTKQYKGRNTLSADVSAVSSDGLLQFDLDFDFGDSGHYRSSPKSLYSIRVRYKGA